MEKARLLPALGAGFSLIRREPVSVLLWGAVYLGFAFLPMLVFLPVLGSTFLESFRAASGGAPDGAPAALGLLGGLAQFAQIVFGLISAALIYSAIYRATLRPAERGFAYLRFSVEEFNLGVVMVVLALLLLVGLFVGLIALGIPSAILFALLGTAGEGGGMAAAGVISLLVLAAGVAAIVPIARLGMALPMTIAERRIRIFEAWTFTKGYTWSLLGLALMQLLMLIAVYLLVILAIVAVAFAGGAASMLANLGETSPGDFSTVWPVFFAVIFMYLLAVFVMMPITHAPWARAYQLIAQARGDDKNAVFD